MNQNSRGASSFLTSSVLAEQTDEVVISNHIAVYVGLGEDPMSLKSRANALYTQIMVKDGFRCKTKSWLIWLTGEKNKATKAT